ncbi:glycosyl hydrolase family 8 [Methylobacterium indicum]|uniref:cellulase n=1 Tax=Methylobacterium indicum TaxID=1775910 RepID=A0A8H8WZH3_9HYPH|nr:glycosyl hydrolase family 8 [Methylobacterium indicum]BCM87229.1 endoglucanase [Methylobacterium indicum]
MFARASTINRRALFGLGIGSAFAGIGAGSSLSGSTFAASMAQGAGEPVRRLASLTTPSVEDRREYATFVRRFVAPDGRVVDTYNGGVSHSEGQGWGLLMAVSFNDPATFDRIHGWTRRHLRRPADSLHAWRFQPQAKTPVDDLNNATDGDLYIAGALARAGRLWRRPDLSAEAGQIGQDILRLLVRRVGQRIVLLPGAYGFDREGGVIVNPSYYAFPMIHEVAQVAPSGVWSALETDGLRLIEDGRFGKWDLPPDWLRVDQRTGALSPAPSWPARFSYDAIRIPLHLAWCRTRSQGALAAFWRYWEGQHPFPPSWVDLQSGTIAPYPADPGTRAVAALALRTRAGGEGGTLPSIGEEDHYYPSALIMLSRIAMQEFSTIT